MKLPNGALELAISQAFKSPMNHRHGSVIWKGKQILAAGYNYHISAPNRYTRGISIHSEKDCLKGLRAEQIYGANILAVRITNAGNLSHGEPCTGCKKLLKRKGIRKVFWFNEDKELNYIRLN